MRSLRFLFFFSFLLLLTGCSHFLYLSKMGWRQSFIMSRSVPVEEILNNENTSAQWKEKIHFIQEVKDYGEKKLGLKKTKNYSKFFEVQDSILYVITACEKDRFQLLYRRARRSTRQSQPGDDKPDSAVGACHDGCGLDRNED